MTQLTRPEQLEVWELVEQEEPAEAVEAEAECVRKRQVAVECAEPVYDESTREA